MPTTRREFLQLSARGLGVLALSRSLPLFATGSAATDHRVLVLIHLAGGNDGLNTVIPYADENYYRLRPTLAIAKDRTLPVTDTIGLHPACAPLQRLLTDGELSIIQDVGHQQLTKSHARAMQLWDQTREVDGVATGWLGRYVDLITTQPPDAGLPLAVYHTASQPPALATANDALTAGFRTDFRLQAAARTGAIPAGYPTTAFARSLCDIAALVASEQPVRVHCVTLDGFDTHSHQITAHHHRLAVLAEGLQAFQRDLKGRQLDGRVLTVVFSEFGRDQAENESRGTAHGAAGPVFVLGPRLRTPLLGTPPILDGSGDNPGYGTDFRQLYAAVLENWMQCPSEPVLGEAFPKLELF